jgi:hypothetical protein
VDGIAPHRMLLELCTGRKPSAQRAPTGCTVAASLVSRRFDGRALDHEPDAACLARVQELYPDAAVMLYLKRGLALAREMKWLGSYRYAVVNLGGANEQDLESRYHDIKRLLGLEPL